MSTKKSRGSLPGSGSSSYSHSAKNSHGGHVKIDLEQMTSLPNGKGDTRPSGHRSAPVRSPTRTAPSRPPTHGGSHHKERTTLTSKSASKPPTRKSSGQGKSTSKLSKIANQLSKIGDPLSDTAQAKGRDERSAPVKTTAERVMKRTVSPRKEQYSHLLDETVGRGDMVLLEPLTEDGLIENLRIRYKAGEIYVSWFAYT